MWWKKIADILSAEIKKIKEKSTFSNWNRAVQTTKMLNKLCVFDKRVFWILDFYTIFLFLRGGGGIFQKQVFIRVGHLFQILHHSKGI